MPAGNLFVDLAAPGVSGLAPYEPGKPLEELEREYGIRDAIKLASNENPRGAAPGALDAARRALSNTARYPDGGCFGLRAALADHLNVDTAMLTFGNGSNDVLVLLAETFLTAEHSAVYDQHSFVVYRLAVQACGAHARIAPSNPREHAQPFGHDLAAMRSLVDDDTRLVFIANPNNPTGTWLEQAKLREFLQSLPEHVIAVLDEAYLEYARQADEADTLTWLADMPNLVIVRTFSKAYGLAGLRIGYAVSHPALAELMNRVRQPFNVNMIAQAGAQEALGNQDWLAESVSLNTTTMQRLQSGLDSLGCSWIPSRGNFLLMDMGTAERASACYRFLLKAGVIVRPVANYRLPACLRVTVGLPDEVDRFLGTLAVFLESLDGH